MTFQFDIKTETDVAVNHADGTQTIITFTHHEMRRLRKVFKQVLKLVDEQARQAEAAEAVTKKSFERSIVHTPPVGIPDNIVSFLSRYAGGAR